MTDPASTPSTGTQLTKVFLFAAATEVGTGLPAESC